MKILNKRERSVSQERAGGVFQPLFTEQYIPKNKISIANGRGRSAGDRSARSKKLCKAEEKASRKRANNKGAGYINQRGNSSPEGRADLLVPLGITEFSENEGGKKITRAPSSSM